MLGLSSSRVGDAVFPDPPPRLSFHKEGIATEFPFSSSGISVGFEVCSPCCGLPLEANGSHLELCKSWGVGVWDPSMSLLPSLALH